jgi:membrane-associated phospholipid phosphatase
MTFEIFWQFISFFGDRLFWIVFFIISGILYLFLDKRRRKKISWIFYSLLPSILVLTVFIELLKISFQIPRPCIPFENCPSGYSFPSGHTAIISTFTTITILQLKKPKIYIPLIILTILVGASRIFLDYHTLADVIFGALVGIFVAIVMNKAVNKFFIKPDKK